MMTQQEFNRWSPGDRRRFLGQAATTLLGVSALPNGLYAKANTAPLRKRPARRVISLFMSGGMPQHETFSPRPDAPAEIRGDGRAIDSAADGIQLGHWLPKLAAQMKRAVVFRAMSSNQGAHAEGRYFVKTNWRKRGTIQHPHMGSWANKLGPASKTDLPGFISLTGLAKEVGAGFLGSSAEPLIIRDPETGIANAHLRGKDTEAAMAHRLSLAQRMNNEFRKTFASTGVNEHAAMFEATTKLMRSSDLDAFDISKESKPRRKLYGGSRFGQGCLLARRLSASGVRYVEVELGGWDTHTDHFERVPALLKELDTGLGALLQDLSASGELEETLITVTSEFGRTPQINQNAGRDHYPQAFSALIAGGGIHGGQAHGSVDQNGIEIVDGKVDVTDFNATIGWALGLDVRKEIYSTTGRPFTLAGKGRPLTQLFSA